MANKISLTSENLKYLRFAFAHFFPEDTIYAADKPYVSGEFNWKNRSDFIGFVFRLTGINIKSAKDLESIKKAQLAVESLASDSGVEESVAESNLPDKEARAAQEAERQIRSEQLKETSKSAQESVERSIETKQKLYEKRIQAEKVAQAREAKLREAQEKAQSKANSYTKAREERYQKQQVPSYKQISTAPQARTTEVVVEEPPAKPLEEQLFGKKITVQEPLEKQLFGHNVEVVEPTVTNIDKTEEIRESIKTKIQQQEKISEALKDKKIYAKVVLPEVPEPTESTKQFIDQAKNYPQDFRQDLSNAINTKISTSEVAQNLSKEEISILADKTANDTIFAINNPVLQTETNIQTAIMGNIAENTSVIKSVTPNPSAQEFFVTAPSEISFYTNSTELSRNILASVNNDLAISVFGSDPSQIEFTYYSQPKEGYTHEIDLNKLSNGYTNLLNSQSQVLDDVTSFGKDHAKRYLMGQARNFLDKQILNLPTNSFVSQIYNSAFGQQVLDFVGLSKYIPFGNNLLGGFIEHIPGASTFFEGLGNTLGIDFGIGTVAPAAEVTTVAVEGAAAVTEGAVVAGEVTTGVIATEVAGGAAVGGAVVGAEAGVATGAATGVAAGAGGGAAAGAAAGSWGGPLAIITAAIGAIVGWIASKIPWDKIKENAPYLIGGLLGLLTFGVAGPLMGVFVGVGSFGLAAAAAGGPITLARVGSKIGGFFASLGAIFFTTIGMPVLISLLIIPIVVVLILFIINSGAYITPPPTSIYGDVTSPYISIVKTPTPPGPFQNSDLPKDITYNIEITAKEGPLTNVAIEYNCFVVSNTPQICETPSGVPTSVDTISPSAPFTFSYTSSYGNEYKDSAIVDTITVTADVSGMTGVTSNGSASVIFGKPPDECPNNSWPIINGGYSESITQGPLTPAGWTHNGVENAIDIGAPSGSTVVATHGGIATSGEGACGGKYVKIQSTCGGASFYSYYGHLGVASVGNSERVTTGQVIGISDNTGTCTTGAHLHFQFFDTVKDLPKTQKPYLIRNIPIGCTNQTSSPCN